MNNFIRNMSYSLRYLQSPVIRLIQFFNTCNRNANKLAIELDNNVSKQIENNEIKAKQHPGVIQLNRIELPTHIGKALTKVIGDYPIKNIIKDGRKLNNFIASRHPPLPKGKSQAIVNKIIAEVDTIMPPGEYSILDDKKQKKWQLRRNNLINSKIRQRMYAWKPSSFNKYEAIVYAIGRGAKEYSVLKRILYEISVRDPIFKPNSYLDFGSGVGTGMWAASDLWLDNIYEFFNVDKSREMNDLSELILRGGNENQHMKLRNVFYRQFLPEKTTSYDLIVSAYSLFELPSLLDRKNVILTLWKKCSNYMVLIEEGSRRGYELINEARQLILNLTNVDLVGHVFAPCPHNKPCPRFLKAQDETPCNFEISFMQPFLNRTSNKGSPARYSYVVFKKGPPQQQADKWPRLVRPTLARSKHTICRMCTSEGKLQEIIFTNAKHGKATHHCARNSQWGDRLPIYLDEVHNSDDKQPQAKQEVSKDR